MGKKRVEVVRQYLVPEWVTYVAQDGDGDWFGWEKKPTRNHVDNLWSGGGWMYYITSGLENDMWGGTLREVV